MVASLLSVLKLAFFITLVTMVGCATGYAPVSDLSSGSRSASTTHQYRSSRVVTTLPQKYRVKAGDTLYSIAWRYGLDFKDLAKKNKIANDYLIYRGQILLIGAAASAQNAPDRKVNTSKKQYVKRDTSSTKASSQRASSTTKNTSSKSKSSTSVSKSSGVKAPSQSGAKVQWRWPVTSKQFTKYSSENKGLDFKGERGQDVRAAASGKVVYAGNGIIGYGNLIIIKHTDEYLSAYAHNSVILVKDNDVVKAGKKIAEIGSSGTTQTILHFEIRKDGKPVDPLRYLPKY